VDAKTVYAEASETSNAIMRALIASGVSRSAIESTSQVLQRTPPYEIQQLIGSNTAEWVQSRFRAVQSWSVRVSPDDAAKTLNTAINAGANESGWIEWMVQNENALKAEASAKSLASARATAEQMAKKLNVHLGRLVSAGESPQNWPYATNGAVAGGVGIGQEQTPPLSITSRRVQMTVTVSATFSIE
jgi:hypothetical protein